MVRYIVNRLLSSIFILIVITIVAFTIIQIPPGDFAEVYKAELVALGGTSEEQAEEAANRLRDKYGLLDPLPIQYIKWIGAIVLHGDFGWSFSQRVDVSQLLAQRLPRTLWIALSAHAISSLVGIILGIYVANRQYSFADNTAAAFAFFATSFPRFSIALIIMYFLAFGLGWEHVSAMHSPEFRYAPWSIEKAIDLLKHVGPVILIAGLGGVARNLRVMRGNLLDVLNQQYVTTARSKGLHERRVLNRHAVPNALASYHCLSGHGAALYAAGRVGGGNCIWLADHRADVRRSVAETRCLFVGQHHAALRHIADRGQFHSRYGAGCARSANFI